MKVSAVNITINVKLVSNGDRYFCSLSS